MQPTSPRGSHVPQTSSFLVLAAVIGAAVAWPAPVRAEYTCTVVDVPGSTYTQLWQLNDSGSVAAGSSLGAYIYSTSGAQIGWSQLPPMTGHLPENVSALGINNAGTVTGPAHADDGASSEGFILAGGAYSFFSYPGYPFTQPRAISNSGIVTGLAHDATGLGPAFVYNPAGAPGYPPGFTDIVPELPDGEPAWWVIPGMINDAGQMVGSANFSDGRHAFLYDPNWQANGYDQLMTLFRVGGTYTAARGINDKGYVAGFTLDAGGAIVAYVLTDLGYELIDCAGDLPGVVETYGESINDDDVVSGIWLDTEGNYHGFVAYPDVVLPVSSADGTFVFDVAVSPATPVFLDPEVAVGYRYEVGAGDPLFASVSLPLGIGDDVFTLLAGERAFTLRAGESFDFAAHGFDGGTGSFEVYGIETAAALDPSDPRAFVTRVTFTAAGRFTGRMTPLTVAGALEDLRLAAAEVDATAGAGAGIVQKVRRAEDFYARGKLPGACKALADFVSDVSRKAGRQILPSYADMLVAEARCAGEAMGCD